MAGQALHQAPRLKHGGQAYDLPHAKTLAKEGF